ncbi:MAG: ABC transporter permease [Nitrososphaerales archaeon]
MEELTEKNKSAKDDKTESQIKGPTHRSRFSQFSAAILVMSLYEMKNYPIVLVNTVLSPLSFLVLITFVSQGRLVGEAILGSFIMIMFSCGMSLQSDLSHLKNDFKMQDMIVSSPTPWQIYVLGMATSELVYSIPAFLVLGILAGIYLPLTLAGALQFVAILATMFGASVALGYTFATFSSDIVQSFAYSRLLSTLFSTIPPVYYPITYIPLPWRYLAYLSPTTYAAQLAQNTAGYLSLSPTAIALDWIILLIVSAVLFVVASTKARWREV